MIGLSGCMAAGTSGGTASYPNVSVQQIPDTVSTLELTVSGPGMTPIQQKGISPRITSLIVEVPVGSDRVFRLLGQVYDPTDQQDPNFNSFVQAFGDERTLGVSSHGTSLAFTLRPFYTKVVFFAYGSVGQYDRSLTNFYSVILPQLSTLVTIDPVVSDMDSQGRLFVANGSQYSGAQGALAGIFRMDNASPQTLFEIDLSGSLVHMSTLAVDSANRLIYFGGIDQNLRPVLGSVKFDGSDVRTDYDISAIPFVAAANQSGPIGSPEITGLDVAADGSLYISGVCTFEVLPAQGGVIHYNPGSEQVVSSYDRPQTGFADVMRKGKYIYALRAQVYPDSEPNAVLQFTPELGLVDELSGTGNPNIAPGQFSTPGSPDQFEFLAPDNPGLYLLDGSDVIFFRDMSGSGWKVQQVPLG